MREGRIRKSLAILLILRPTYVVMSKYQWPASRLDEKEMDLLFQARQKTRKSICELLRQAIHIAYGEADKVKVCIIKNERRHNEAED